MKLFLTTSLILTTFLTSNFVFADRDSKTEVMNEGGCLSEILIKEITSDFTIVFDGALDSKTISACDTNDITNRLVRGLAFLKHGQFHPSKKSDDETFYNEFEKVKPYDFLKKRISKINLVKKCDGEGTAAYVSSNSTENKFNVCVDNYKNRANGDGANAFDYARIAIHESRHIDIDDPRHVECTQGVSKFSAGSCDSNRHEHGAYHYDTDYLAYIAMFGKNFHPAIQAGSKSSALFHLINRFNRAPKMKTTNFVILKSTDTNQLFSFSSKKILQNLGTITSGKLFSRSDGEFSIYDSIKDHFTSWNFFKNKIENAVGSYAPEYNSKKFSGGDFVDIIHLFGSESFTNAMIVGSDLKYSIRGKDDQIEKLPFQNPKRFLKPEFCGKDNDSLYILTEDQRVFRIRELFSALKFEEVSTCQTGFLNITLFGNTKLGLTTDGRLLELTDKTWTPLSGFEAKKFNFLSDSFDTFDFFETANRL